jgi:hypothetical protein
MLIRGLLLISTYDCARPNKHICISAHNYHVSKAKMMRNESEGGIPMEVQVRNIDHAKESVQRGIYEFLAPY